MSKSIIIFGKGPSVSRCTRELVDQYDDIIICNYPVLNDFFNNLIKFIFCVEILFVHNLIFIILFILELIF